MAEGAHGLPQTFFQGVTVATVATGIAFYPRHTGILAVCSVLQLATVLQHFATLILHHHHPLFDI
jgi:hypothetical protein